MEITMQSTRVVTAQGEVAAVKHVLLSRDAGLQEKAHPESIAWQLTHQDRGVVTAYPSGKIVIQSSDSAWMDRMAGAIAPAGAMNHDRFIPRIGSDEAGKGDFFGPLVVAAVFVETEAQERQLLKAGVRDSKKLSDALVMKIYQQVAKICPFRSEVVMTPDEYNSSYSKVRNANIVLARGHAYALENVLDSTEDGDCSLVVIDQFSHDTSRVMSELGEKARAVQVKQMHRGEADVAVAAASVLARARFLKEMKEMNEKYAFVFPKGASDVVRRGKDFVRAFGVEELRKVAKISFKTALAVTSSFDLGM